MRRCISRVGPLLALACLAVGLGSGCSASTETAQVQTVIVEKTTPQPAPRAKPPKATTTPRPVAEFTHCDANIEVRAATTTCPFAQNTFWHYWTEGRASALSVYSPAAGTALSTNCTASGGRVQCTTSDQAVVRFSQAAVDSYSADQAAKYADSHDLGPDGGISSDPPEPDPDTGEPGEDIPNYDEGRGYRVQCNDGMYSQSGGIQGACSGHDGVAE